MSNTTAEIIRQTAGILAGRLTDGFTLDVKRTDDSEGWAAWFTHPTGASLTLAPRNSRQKYSLRPENFDRWEITAFLPAGYGDVLGRTLTGHRSASVHRDRDIIGAVKRATPAEFWEDVDYVVEGLQRNATAAESLAARIADTAASVPGSYVVAHGTRDSVHLPTSSDDRKPYGDVRFNHDGSGVSELKLRSFPADLLPAILAAAGLTR